MEGAREHTEAVVLRVSWTAVVFVIPGLSEARYVKSALQFGSITKIVAITKQESMFRFFATESTLAKLSSSHRVAVLFGGFSGCWNFGDVAQLLGAIRWHSSQQQVDTVCAIATLASVHDMDWLVNVFGVQEWIFYKYYEDDSAAPEKLSIAGYTLHSVEQALSSRQTIFHVYGGGFLNRFWGAWQLHLIEEALRQFQPSIYVVSGQQIDPEFSSAVAEHIRTYKPLLFGCRDQESVAALSVHDINAHYSGDDSWEVLSQWADAVGRSARRWWLRRQRRSFGLHLNLSWYTHQDNPDNSAPSVKADVLQGIQDAFAALQEQFGIDTCPLVVCAYPDSRLELLDSLSSVEMTFFTMYFPKFIAVDLIGLLAHNRWSLLKPMLDNVKIFIASSYHTALFFKMLGVPTLLCAFNQYYQQKVKALGQDPMSVREFLSQDVNRHVQKQTLYLQQHKARREEWLRLFHRTSKHFHVEEVQL